MLPCTELQTFLFENISQSFLIVGICALFIKLGRFFCIVKNATGIVCHTRYSKMITSICIFQYSLGLLNFMLCVDINNLN